MQHTPAPWSVTEADWSDCGDVRYTLNGNRLANMADARLIESAPDLFAALEEILNDPEPYHTNQSWVKARAALAKAKGDPC